MPLVSINDAVSIEGIRNLMIPECNILTLNILIVGNYVLYIHIVFYMFPLKQSYKVIFFYKTSNF